MNQVQMGNVELRELERAIVTADECPGAMASRRPRISFSGVMAGAMLAIVLTGFGPAFFLRAFFDVPDIPLYLILHGAISSAWFVWLVVQTMLVSSGRADLHRRLGVIGVLIGVAVVASGIQTSLGMIPRRIAGGIDFESEIAFIGIVSSANFAFFIVFPTLLALAVYFRRRPDVHRRLMLLLSISIVGPAALRIASWFGEVPNPINFIITFSFVAALLAHDIKTRGRPHLTTIAGTLFVVAVNLTFQFVGVGDRIVAYRLAGH